MQAFLMNGRNLCNRFCQRFDCHCRLFKICFQSLVVLTQEDKASNMSNKPKTTFSQVVFGSLQGIATSSRKRANVVSKNQN